MSSVNDDNFLDHLHGEGYGEDLDNERREAFAAQFGSLIASIAVFVCEEESNFAKHIGRHAGAEGVKRIRLDVVNHIKSMCPGSFAGSIEWTKIHFTHCWIFWSLIFRVMVRLDLAPEVFQMVSLQTRLVLL